MRSLNLKIAILMTTVFLGSNALAMFEINGGYLYHPVSPGDLNSVNQGTFGTSYPGHTAVTGFAADGRFYLPVKFGFGVRYNSLSDSISQAGITSAITATRLAVLAGYRFIDMPTSYLGVVGTYGVAHTMKQTMTGYTDATTVSQTSYSVGAEGGLRFGGHFQVGVEVGYLYFVGKEVQQSGVDVLLRGATFNIDLSGLYALAGVGVTF